MTNYPDALFNVLDLLEQAQKATQRGALEAVPLSLSPENTRYILVLHYFRYIFLDLFVGETSSVKLAADFQRYMCETIKGYEEISEGEAFSEYIHRICIPFFDYALTAVEYMVDEHATLEVAFQETVVGELCGVEIADVELFRPAQPDSSPV